MPERSHKDTVASARSTADSLGDDYKPSRDPELNEQRAARRRERRQGAIKANDQAKSRWAPCIWPDCRFTTMKMLKSGIEFPICSLHAAAVWEHVEERLNDRDPLLTQALDGIRSRREVIRAEWRKREEIAKTQWSESIKRPDADGEIYYVRANGLIKVGWTSDIHKRLRAYGANAELLCHYPATRLDETNLHRQLAPSRAKGREWYNDDPVIQAFIYRAIREHGAPTVKVAWTEPSRSKVRVKNWRG